MSLGRSQGRRLPWYLFATQDGKQIAAFRVHPADLVNSYMRWKSVTGASGRSRCWPRERATTSAATARRKLDTAEFATNNGIKLGMTRPNVERLGRCFKLYKARGSTETFLYGVGDIKAGLPILKLANMPFYYAEYQFERGKLVRYRFGYDYP